LVFGTTFGRKACALYYFIPRYSVHFVIVPRMLSWGVRRRHCKSHAL